MKNNICLCGWKRSGKTRSAQLFVENGYTQLKFATPLKRIVGKSFLVNDTEDKEQEISMFFAAKDKARQIVFNILVELGLTEYGANVRLDEESVRFNPVSKAGGITPEQMFKDVAEMLFDLQKKELEHPIRLRHILQQLGTDVMRKWDEDIHITMMEEVVRKCTKPFIIDDARFPNEVAFARKQGAEVYWLHRPALVPEDFHESEVSLGQDDCDTTIISREGDLLDVAILNYIKYGYWRDTDVIKKGA